MCISIYTIYIFNYVDIYIYIIYLSYIYINHIIYHIYIYRVYIYIYRYHINISFIYIYIYHINIYSIYIYHINIIYIYIIYIYHIYIYHYISIILRPSSQPALPRYTTTPYLQRLQSNQGIKARHLADTRGLRPFGMGFLLGNVINKSFVRYLKWRVSKSPYVRLFWGVG